ncbi:class I SAM-dependent methyltransferase [Allokutzneria oryzae]|uniref:Methyltransferase domain-containing protein n=1 Tax=Allokutzneria oryzae TaxID=1378989 RepID=A0ABV6A4W5_9PSEU
METVVNTEQAEAWNGYEGNHWADNHDRYNAVNSGFNDPLLTAAAIGEHDRVLDIGCGTGQVTRLAALRAPGGHAVGVDLSAPMLRRAEAIAAAEGVANARFVHGDAQVHPLGDAEFDVAVSRFGVMFFADPVAAFTNVARALRPGGRVALLVIRELAGLSGVLAAVERHLPASPDPAKSGTGPLSLSDPDVVHEVFTAAGFTDIAATAVDAQQVWGRDAVDAAGFLGDWGPLRFQLDKVDQPTAAKIRAELIEQLRPFEEPDAVRLRGAAWLITAVRS